MKKNLIELQNILSENKILISFSGRFYQGIIEELGEAIKKHMEVEASPKSNIHNVFSIFIEQSQNIRNYIIHKDSSSHYNQIANSGIVCISKSEDNFFISSGNLIENTDIAPLKEKLDLILTMDKDELKKFYKQELKKEIPSDSVSAGVGLIDIARKSNKPLEYTLQRIDDNLSFFELKAIV